MSLVKFESLWKSMTKYQFEFEYVCEELICILCKKVMIDARQSACGCQYCYQCIIAYLRGQERQCPGDTEMCYETYLEVDLNVIRNKKTNYNISKLKVQCPNKNCEFKSELIRMEDHLKLCLKQSLTYTLSCISRDEEEANGNEETQSLNDLKNEVKELRSYFENSQNEIVFLEEKVKCLEKQILDHEDVIELIKEDARNKEIRLTQLETEVINKKNIRRNTVEDTGSITDERHLQKSRETDLEEEGEIVQNRDNNIISQQGRRLQSTFKSDFVWKVEECSTKTWIDLFSESFYSHNYKFILSLNIVGDNINLLCYIMKGDRDDKVKWPMMLAVTLCIIDQESMTPYKSVTFQYDTFKNKSAFNKPKNKRNDYYIGEYSKILYSNLKKASSVIVNDSIIVSCNLEDISSTDF